MSKTTINVTVAVSTMKRWPYYKARALGPRAGLEPGELAIPLVLHIDSALLRRTTAKVVIDVPDLEAPSGHVAT